jgi:hypothetical protein
VMGNTAAFRRGLHRGWPLPLVLVFPSGDGLSVVAAPRLLSEEWMLIGRQEDTGFGGRVDLLAVAPDGAVVLVELKRDRTPREVVGQAVDYAYCQLAASIHRKLGRTVKVGQTQTQWWPKTGYNDVYMG